MAINTQALLERNELFRGLSTTTLHQVAALAIRRPYKDGSLIFSQSDEGDALYGVINGKIRISASSSGGKEIFLNILGPGDSFGEIALLDGRPRTATAIAMATSELIIITREHFLALMYREPKVLNHVLQLLCQRIRWASGLAEEFGLLTVPARLARRLLSLARLHGRRVPNGINLNISQEEVARFLGLSRQVVNQYLQIWKAKDWVGLGRGKIVIISESALQQVVAASSSQKMNGPRYR